MVCNGYVLGVCAESVSIYVGRSISVSVFQQKRYGRYVDSNCYM